MQRHLAWIGIAVLFFAASSGSAQNPTPVALKEQLPSDPLIVKRMPAFACWQITMTPKTAPGIHKKGIPINGTIIRSITVQKTAPIYTHHIIYDDGGVGLRWTDGQTEYRKLAGMPMGMLVGYSPYDTEKCDYSQTDFPELAWVNATHFLGVRKYGDKPCLIFQKDFKSGIEIANEAAHRMMLADGIISETGNSTVKGTAVIDSETRLPLAYDTGDSVRHYAYLPAPAAMQTMPDQVKQAVEEHQKALDSIIHKPRLHAVTQ